MQTASAEHLAGSDAPTGANGTRKGTRSLCHEYLIRRRIKGTLWSIGGGWWWCGGGGGIPDPGIPHIFELFNFAGDTRVPCSRRVLRGLRGFLGDDVRVDAPRCDTFPPQPRLLPGFLLPAPLGVPALQRSPDRPCFSDFRTRRRDQRGERAT